jgi:glutamate-ammonia-ligase adenylyltransferase
VSAARRESPTRRLLRAGFADVTRAASLWQDPALVAVLPPDPEGLLTALGRAADPDLALLQLARIAATTAAPALRGLLTPDDAGSGAAVPAPHVPSAVPAERVLVLRRLIAVLGASEALGDEIVRRPALLAELGERGIDVTADAVREDLLIAVGADPAAPAPVAGDTWPDAEAPTATDALRRAYRTRLLHIAADDLTDPDPLGRLPAVAAALADLAGAALEAALAVARGQHPDHARVRLAVIGMGKTGGRELNYVSDVDVVYVAEPGIGPDGLPADETAALAAGARLAATLQRVCGGPSGEPALWQVDAALRPEGKAGPLVRTLRSHLAYYDRWAATWEFQALLKARPVAGDPELGRAYHDAVEPLVWKAVERENFVADAQAMRRRVEANVPVSEADRQIKLGRGGLRDVEFTVQLLQLVHGRTAPAIHSANTLTALAALAAAGYVGRDHAARLADCYRFLRALEHRVQLHRLRRTHLLPTTQEDLRRLARALGLRADGPEGLTERWRATRREVRSLHEALFYRPLLPAYAQLSEADVSLAPEQARHRFAAIGYRDPDGAMRHVNALTEGTSRRAALQRQLLPVLLGWFADGADPDGGLLAFRKLSDELGSTHWYLKLLRDSGSAAQSLAHVLSSSRYLADAIARSPESVRWFDDASGLEPRGPARLAGEAAAVLRRTEDAAAATTVLRAVRRRELARTGAGEVLGTLDPVRAAAAISDAADVVLRGSLRAAERAARRDLGLDESPTRLLVVAMGRLGGREMGYGSDADVMFVHDPRPGADPQVATRFALATATRMRELVGAVGSEPALPVDADLRPEGRQGPLVRTLASYTEYYERWASVWEAQALLRARPLVPLVSATPEMVWSADASPYGPTSPSSGSPDDIAEVQALADRFVAVVDVLRYPVGGLPAAGLREVRRIKARVEAERLPRGVEPTRHLKLGRGGVADVEWTAQLLQLQHAHTVPALRTTGTVAALDAAQEAGLLDADDAHALRDAWTLASRLRSAVVLWSGRVTGVQTDVLPHDRQALTGVARLLGDVGDLTGGDLEELYLRTARRARTVMERVFYAAED